MPSRQIRTAVIPAAGLGTRFLPATRLVPKEMLPVAGRPLIQFAVDEALASGLETVILVLRKGKELIAQHFQTELGVDNAHPRPNSEDSSTAARARRPGAQFRIAWQESPLGLADAIRASRPLIHDEPFAVILPDALIDSAVPCIAQLMACYEKHPGCIVATQQIDSTEVERFGVVDVSPIHDDGNSDRTMVVNALVERPQPGTVSSRYGIFGRYILEPRIFSSIDRIPAGFNGELQLTDAIMLHSATAPVYAYEFDGTHYDAGSKLGFVEATLAYALKDSEIAGALRARFASVTT